MAPCPRELQVIRRPLLPKHDAVEAIVIGKAVQHCEPQAIGIESNDGVKIVAGSRDAEDRNLCHAETRRYITAPTCQGTNSLSP